MKKRYLFIIITIVLIIIFRDSLINLSLPLIEDRIRNQLNILDNENTVLELKTDFTKRTIELTARNAVLKETNNTENGFIKEINVQKEFKNLFNNKISKLTIDQLEINLLNQNIDDVSNDNLNLNDLMFNLKINIRDYEKINIFNSKLNFHKILENHSINFNLFNYDKKLNSIESVGIMINNKSQNEFKISNQNEKDLIDIELNLDSYSTNFVNKIIDNPDLNIIFENSFNGKINIKTNIDFNKIEFFYDLSSIDKSVYLKGNSNIIENFHNSIINLKDFSIKQFLPKNGIFNLIDISQFGKFNALFKIEKDFDSINFQLNNLNNDFNAYGIIENGLVNQLKLNISNIILEDFLKDVNLLNSIKLSELDQLNINLETEDNFKKTNFFIETISKNFTAQGVIHDNEISKLSSSASNLNINNFLKNVKIESSIIPDWVNEEFINNNIFSYELDFNKNDQEIIIKITDKNNNVINTKYNLRNNLFTSLNVLFFGNKSNNLIWSSSDNKLIININKSFDNFIFKNYNKNIFNDLKIGPIDSFDSLIFEGITNIRFNEDLLKFNSNDKFFKNYFIYFKQAKLNTNSLESFNDFFEYEGESEIFYKQDNISNNKSFKIDLSNSYLAIDKLKYKKEINRPLELNFDFINTSQNNFLINNIKVIGENTDILGEIKIKNKNLIFAKFDTFKFLENNFGFELNKQNFENKNPIYNLFIKGKSVDLSFFKISEAKSTFKDITINLNMNVKVLKYINNTIFSPVEAKGKFRNVWQNLFFKGLFDTGEDLTINIDSFDNSRLLKIQSSNAGKALKIKNISKSINGGRLRFEAIYNSLETDDYFDGKLSLTDFAIKKKSKLSTFIKFIRIFDIKKQLDGDTEDFEYAEMQVNRNKKVYNIDNGKVYGGLMALTAKGFINKENDLVNIEGLVAPTYAIDSWIGNIPIIGTIVTGIEGGGVFAANYSVKGTVKDPKYFVNPLSVLTPGLFKDFWKIFQNPTD